MNKVNFDPKKDVLAVQSKIAKNQKFGPIVLRDFWLCVLLSLILLFLFMSISAGKSDPSNVVIAPCKYKPHAQDAQSAEGMIEFGKNSCSSCHSIQGKGGCLAPPLDGIGAHRTSEFILARITDDIYSKKQFEKLYPGQELLEHPRIPIAKARVISDYLMTLPEPDSGFVIAKHIVHAKRALKEPGQKLSASPAEIAAGKKLFNEHGCISCHSIGNIGGRFAPRLDGLNTRHDADYIRDRISTTEFLAPQTSDEYSGKGAVMPPTNLTRAQIEQVTTFLMSLPQM